jgi:hypothetical protein
MLALEYGRADECIRIARRIPTALSSPISGPEKLTALFTLLALESLIHEEVQSIFVLGEHI